MSLNTVKYKGELLAEDERISTDTPGVLGEYKELRADALEADTLDITVLSESGTIRNFKKNDKVEYFRSGSRVGVYYLQSVTRVGPKLYTLSALSAVGLLIVRPHRGGIYTGQTVAEVVAEICGDIPVLVETVYRGIKLYGWLPIASARDSLVQVLFAIGSWLHTDENGTLRGEHHRPRERPCRKHSGQVPRPRQRGRRHRAPVHCRHGGRHALRGHGPAG